MASEIAHKSITPIKVNMNVNPIFIVKFLNMIFPILKSKLTGKLSAEWTFCLQLSSLAQSINDGHTSKGTPDALIIQVRVSRCAGRRAQAQVPEWIPVQRYPPDPWAQCSASQCAPWPGAFRTGIETYQRGESMHIAPPACAKSRWANWPHGACAAQV